MDWTYSGHNGPDKWHTSFPEAAGTQQSPVDIQPVDAKVLAHSLKLTWRYSPEETRALSNTGHSWKVDANGGQSELTGGPLGDDKYVLKQFHCHWGETDDCGSEHTVGGKPYAGELHFVHFNETKYHHFEEAVKHSDGLCVLAVFLKPGQINNELMKVVDHLPQITFKGAATEMNEKLDPTALIPTDSGYWTYMGSLTTPPCNECVIWIIFKDPIEASSKQLEAMRSLRSHSQEHIIEEHEGMVKKNCRPVAPLGKREIQECH